MGGITADLSSRTALPRLYACGETCCNGVHGRNRLASNSLLESLVFAQRAADDILYGEPPVFTGDKPDLAPYREQEPLFAAYRQEVLTAIERSKTMNEITQLLHIDPLLLQALREDIPEEDVSTNAVMPHACPGTVDLIAKEDGIVAGLAVYARVFTLLDPGAKVEFFCRDGDTVQPGQKLAVVTGDIRALLSGERVALNYLQRMSGIATYTHQLSALLEGTGITLLDTRKTSPNNRIFEKYAVRVGGGSNHRTGLSDGVLLKDNHIGAAGGVAKAVKMARQYASFVRKIEVEVETLEQVKEAVEAGADIIMLDNMSDEDMRKAVTLIAGRAKTECSGNVTRENIARLRDIGIDYVSSGALTHSAPILDLSMKHLRPLTAEEA